MRSLYDDIHEFLHSDSEYQLELRLSWQPPPAVVINVNIDGSFLPDSGLMGAGGVARDDHGDKMKSMSKPIGFQVYPKPKPKPIIYMK